MLKALQKKILIAYLQFIKVIFPHGKKVRMRSVYGEGLYFWLDKYTDNGFILGFYEQELAELLFQNINKGSVFYDLGAHWGYFSILASKFVGTKGKVYAFEPMPQNFHRLEQNIHINNIKNVTLLNLAVANENGTIKFSDSNDTFANTYINASSKDFIEVKATSLDQLMVAKSVLPPHFIKIDVEGAEIDVLQGAEGLIKEHRPIIHLSTHDIHSKGVDEKCKLWMQNTGYGMKKLSSKDGIADYICEPSIQNQIY